MNKKKLNRIFLLSAAGALLLLAVLGVARTGDIRSDTPIVIEQADIDIISVEAVQITPEPTPTPVLPEYAVTLLFDRRSVFTLESEPATQRLLWAYLLSSAAAPEGETFVSARFNGELLITQADPAVELRSYEDALSLLTGQPGLVPVRVEALRVACHEGEPDVTASEEPALAAGSRIIKQIGAGESLKSVTPVTYVAGKEDTVGEAAITTIREKRSTIVQNGAYAHKNKDGEPEKDEGVKGKDPGQLKLALPMKGSVVSYFGFRGDAMHNGIDIENKEGTPVAAPGEGLVVYCAERGAYGLLVDIDHGNGFVSRLTHLQNVQVEMNQRVFAGDPIGELAPSSSEDKKPHLHYELIIDAIPYNPLFYMG